MVFNNLTDEIFSYLDNPTRVVDYGKSVSIDRKSGQEIVMFFKLDKGYLKGGTPKADFLCYYHNIKSKKRFIFIIELKGADTNYAIKQLEATITHGKMEPLIRKFEGVKKAIVVYTGSAPKNLRQKKKEFKDKWGIILEAKHSSHVNLREFL